MKIEILNFEFVYNWQLKFKLNFKPKFQTSFFFLYFFNFKLLKSRSPICIRTIRGGSGAKILKIKDLRNNQTCSPRKAIQNPNTLPKSPSASCSHSGLIQFFQISLPTYLPWIRVPNSLLHPFPDQRPLDVIKKQINKTDNAHVALHSSIKTTNLDLSPNPDPLSQPKNIVLYCRAYMMMI